MVLKHFGVRVDLYGENPVYMQADFLDFIEFSDR